MSAAGRHVEVDGQQIWVVDRPAVDPTSDREPLLYLHGFPTSSLDLEPVAGALAQRRRVVAFDFLGSGRSAKPDRWLETVSVARREGASIRSMVW